MDLSAYRSEKRWRISAWSDTATLPDQGSPCSLLSQQGNPAAKKGKFQNIKK